MKLIIKKSKKKQYKNLQIETDVVEAFKALAKKHDVTHTELILSMIEMVDEVEVIEDNIPAIGSKSSKTASQDKHKPIKSATSTHNTPVVKQAVTEAATPVELDVESNLFGSNKSSIESTTDY